MHQISIRGRIPSKKNSRITTRTGRSFPSAKYTEWHEDASWQLKNFKEKIPNGTHLLLKFYFPDNRKCDLTNKAESIMDLLVDNGFLQDDNYSVIPVLQLQFECVDKDNPRCIIEW